MAQIPYRANLNTKAFPFDSGNFGRTVIVPGNDQYADETNPGIPQVYYVQNAVPTEFGYKSVNPVQIKAAPVIAAPNDIGYFFGASNSFFNDASILNKTTFFIRNNYNTTTPLLTLELFYTTPQLSTIVQAGSGYLHKLVDTTFYNLTTLQINGRNFVCHPLLNDQFPPGTPVFSVTEVSWTYSPSPTYWTLTRTARAITGIAATTLLKGFISNRGRMITWDKTTVFWSSLTDPVDFTPSLITGAGNTKVQDARGEILWCSPTLYGFLIYCTDNIVAAEYTGNLASPWSFREIYNSAGILSIDVVAKDAAVDTQFAITQTGITRISDNVAQVALAELFEILKRKQLTIYNPATATFDTYDFSQNPLQAGLAAVGKRYVAISIPSPAWETPANGVTLRDKFAYCFLYDSVLKKWGMVKVDHTAVYTEPETGGVAFLKYTGAVFLMKSCDEVPTPNSFLIIGKYQLSRTRKVSLQQVQIENRTDHATNCIILSTLDGRNISSSAVPSYAGTLNSPLSIFNCNIVGENHSVVFSGEFDINTVLLTGATHGKL